MATQLSATLDTALKLGRTYPLIPRWFDPLSCKKGFVVSL
jgi:hypothetical protein